MAAMFSPALRIMSLMRPNDVVVRVALEVVSGAEPAIDELLPIGIRALVLAQHDRAAAHPQLSALVHRYLVAAFIDDLQLLEGSR